MKRITIDRIKATALLVADAWESDVLGFRKIVMNKPYTSEAQLTEELFHELFDGTEYASQVETVDWDVDNKSAYSNDYEYQVVIDNVCFIALSDTPYEDLKS